MKTTNEHLVLLSPPSIPCLFQVSILNFSLHQAYSKVNSIPLNIDNVELFFSRFVSFLPFKYCDI